MTILIPDTSSLLNLHDIHIGVEHVTEVLDMLFDVRVSTEIPNEIRRNRATVGAYDAQLLGFVRQARRRFYRQQDYDNTLLNSFAPLGNPNSNRGERYNSCLALYIVRKRLEGQVIMLIDDMRAHRGLIAWYEERIKATITWSSLELLLYLYFIMYPRWPTAQANSAMRTVNARMGGLNHVQRLMNSTRYLQDLSAMLINLPRVRLGGTI